MPWYGWLTLAIGGAIAVAALLFRAILASQRGRRFMLLPAVAKIAFGRTLLRDRAVPITAKVPLLLLVGYLALPLDLIPDFVPVIGQADDFFIVTAAVGLLILAVPRERFERALVLAADAAPSHR